MASRPPSARPPRTAARPALRIAAAALALWHGAEGARGGQPPAPEAQETAAVDAQAPEDARFDLYFAGLRIGKMRLTLDYDEEGYAARSLGKSSGVAGLFYEAAFEAAARGVSTGVSARPQRFAGRGTYGDKSVALAIDFGLTGPSAVDAEPPFKPKPYQIEPTAQRGVLDPLSAAAALLRPAPPGAICGRSADVFDGRRRSRITLAAPRPEGNEIACPARFKRVAGYRPKDMAADDIRFQLYFREGEDGLARIHRAVVDTKWGRASAYRRDE